MLGEVDANLERAAEIVAQGGRESSDLVVFPELFLTGYALGQVDEDVSMSADDPRLTQLGAIAPETDVLMGFYEDGLGVHNYNAATYYDGETLVHTHRKLYLPTYDIFEERKHFSPGQTMRAFDTRQGRVATLICNDAWQPHLVFLAVQDGARVLLVPTNSSQSRFPEQYDSGTYWRDITVFYARMFQCYVVFCNRVGDEGCACASGAGRTSSTRGARSSVRFRTTRKRSSPPRSTSRWFACAVARSRSCARRGSACSPARPTASPKRAATRRGGAGKHR